MTAQQIFERKIQQNWNPKIQKKLAEKGIKITNEKLNLIAKMAHVRAINENYPASLDGAQGRGGVAFGNNPNGGNAAFYGTGAKGSAEVWQNLFGVFVEIAATNVGMELVPVIQATKSSGTFYVAEPVYGGGRTDSQDSKPWVIQVKAVAVGTVASTIPLDDTNVGTTYTIVESSGGDSIADLIYVGKHRVNGNHVFKIGQQYDNSGGGGTNYKTETIADALDTAVSGARIQGTGGGNYWSFTSGTVDLVAGFTNFISGFSGAGTNDSDDWFMNRADGKNYSKPMSRKVGERTQSRSMGIRTWHKNYSAETVKTDIYYTIEQIQDMQNDLGMSALEFGEMAIQDQLNQHINGHILGRLFALGWQHHYNMNKVNGFNLNAFIAASSSTGAAQAFLGQDDTLLTISGPSGVLPATGAISENLNSLQRRIITRMLYSSGIIKSRSRRGRADQSIMNTTFGTAVRDVRGFQPAPFDNTIDSNSDLDMIGTLYGMKVYEDGLMDLSDERINVSRKGNEKDPGIKFLPYILAEKLTTVAENTMSPKEALISRYSLLEAGTHPELNMLTFTVQTDDGYAIV